ncbi:FliI/YscN family ATPase [Spirochaeta dissipatitropha]
MSLFDKYTQVLENIEPVRYSGEVVSIKGLLIESHGPQAVLGELCHIYIDRTDTVIAAEVIGIQDATVQLMPYQEPEGIELGCRVVASGVPLQAPVSNHLLGRVIDAMGQPVDGKGPIQLEGSYPVFSKSPNAMQRTVIHEQLQTGVRVIDGLCSVGKGQRLGIFAGSGVGKSTIISMIARNTSADVNVIALIGERGREVREFIENDLGPEGLARSVVVVSTSDTPALARLRGAYVATAIAEFFRDQSKDVMLLFDSVTRFAMAQREIGLTRGEAPASRGFTPSMFAELPRLLERTGTSEKGSITGFYTILVEGDDMNEPVSDTVRGILDGHIVLSRALAEKYHYPAIDALASLSRLAAKVALPEVQKAAGIIRRMLAVYRDAEDLINVGAYNKGSNPDIDAAIDRLPHINAFLQQDVNEKSSIADVSWYLQQISGVEIPGAEDPSLRDSASASGSGERNNA